MKAKLVVVQGKPQGMQIPLQGSQFVVGRDPKCNLRPASDLISKLHCVFLVDGDKLTLRDLKSTNGTFVNSQKLDGTTDLKDGDLVRVGPLVFAVHVEAAQPSASPPPDDDAMQWLMGGEGTDERPVEPSIGSTIMEMKLDDADLTKQPTEEIVRSEHETVADAPVPTESPKKAEAAKQQLAGDTREAAAALLNKYMVRRRN
jgi:predicted component of type VI protein secretion system